MPDFTDRDALYADAINRAADSGLGPHPLPESYVIAARAGVDVTLEALPNWHVHEDGSVTEIVSPKTARPAEPDTLEGLVRAMVPIKQEPLATNVVNEWLERFRAVLSEGVIWEYAIEIPQRTARDKLRRTVPDYSLEGTKKRLKDYLTFAPDAYIVRRHAVDDWEPVP
jgi:hypothetical protein